MNVQSNFKKYQKRASEMLQDNSRIKQLVGATGDKIRAVLDSNKKLKLFSDRILLMIRMVRAQFSGAYTDFPWKSLVMIVGALLYFITPIDLIPDFIPGLGLTDDISIVYWVYQSLREDIARFEIWENTLEVS